MPRRLTRLWMAEERGISANRLLIDAIKDTLRLEKEREWREGFEAMGRDADTDVEYLLPAAREVILRPLSRIGRLSDSEMTRIEEKLAYMLSIAHG